MNLALALDRSLHLPHLLSTIGNSPRDGKGPYHSYIYTCFTGLIEGKIKEQLVLDRKLW